MRRISSTEFALAAALFAVSGATALAENFIRQSDSQERATIAQTTHAPQPVRVSQDSD